MSICNHGRAGALTLGALWVVLAVALALPAAAQNLVVNGDFSNPAGTPAPGGCVAPGWSYWLTPANSETKFWYTGCPFGDQMQRIISGVNSSPVPIYGGGIVQAVATVPGTVYDLELDMEVISNEGSTGSPTQAPNTFYIEGYFGYDLGGQVVDPNATTIKWSNRTKVWNNNQWGHYRTRFTATGSVTSIWIKSVHNKNWGFVDVDNISLTPAGSTGEINNYDAPRASLENPDFENANVTVTPDGTTATINWVTDVPSEGSVEYGLTGPYLTTWPGSQVTYNASQAGAGTTTTHGVTLTGLQANQTYHYRLVNTAAGRKTAYSYDMTFSTAGVHNKSVQPWVLFDKIDGLFGPALAFSTKASHGSYWVASYASSEIKNGGIYQRVQAVPGRQYTVKADFAAAAGGGTAGDDEVFVGIDPLGGNDPTVLRAPGAYPIVWNGNGLGPYYCPDPLTDCGDGVYGVPNTFPAQWNANNPGKLPTEVTAQVAPTSHALTVFVVFKMAHALPFNMTLVDNLQLLSSASVDVPSAGAARQEQDSTVINITEPQVVTLVPNAETGFFYVEAPDRSGGIRVEATATGLAVGDLVTVSGLLKTNDTTGEKALTNATFTKTGSGGAVDPLSMVNKAAGGKGYTGDGMPSLAYGAASEGLLVKVFGQVTDSNFIDTFYIDDGSNVDGAYAVPGIKVIRSDQFPSVGDYVAIVGVMTPEKVSGKKIRVLRGREAQFSSDFETLNP